MSQPELSMGMSTPEGGRRAVWWRRTANMLSYSRAIGGLILGFQMGTADYPVDSWTPAVVATACGVTDYADGRFARKATSIDGVKSRAGGWKDQICDKIFSLAVMSGITLACFRNEQPLAGSVIAASTIIMAGRDMLVTNKRLQAEKANLGIDTSAQMPGKIKTAAQMGGIIALCTPMVEYTPVLTGATTVIGGSAALAVSSGVGYYRQFDQAMIQQPPGGMPQ